MKDKIIIDGIEYVRKDSIKAEKGYYPVFNPDGMEYCMVRTYSAGVFAGYMESRNGKEAILRDARRIWKWAGAATLSQLATDGTSDPQNCKFPCAVDKVTLTEVIEIITMTKKAKKSIEEVPVWKE